MRREKRNFRWNGMHGVAAAIFVGAVGVSLAAFTRTPVEQLKITAEDALVLKGRSLVMEHACGGCHGGADPSFDGWLSGWSEEAPPGLYDFQIGDFHTYARNLTPDNTTGLGRFSERQLFNALRYGLRPGETPDVEITSATPGEGNFPEHPKYLAPPMPWPAWRHMPDEDLWAIVAYLKRGVKPVHNRVPDSEGPPDFWAEAVEDPSLGTYPAPPFPTARETMPPNDVDLDQVKQGRLLVLDHACGDCHGGVANPASDGWMVGAVTPDQGFPVGPCGDDPSSPCLHTWPRNLTPDAETGVGSYSERQIFNALRYGLSPRATPDVEITSDTPGEGNFPEHPTYLAVTMPWQFWRHMSDADLWAIAAYLKHGLKPVSNHVEDSDAPPDAWASAYTADKIGAYPTPAYPTRHEVEETP